MSGEIILTITGNLTNEPEQRNVNGHTTAGFTIAANSRYTGRNGQPQEGNTVFLRCTAWNQLAEHVLQTLRKGMSVIAQGQLRQNSWTDDQGNKRSSMELSITDIGPSLKFATAQVQRAERQQGNGCGATGYPSNGYQNTGYGQAPAGYGYEQQQAGSGAGV